MEKKNDSVTVHPLNSSMTLFHPIATYKFSRLTSAHFFKKQLREFVKRLKIFSPDDHFINSHHPFSCFVLIFMGENRFWSHIHFSSPQLQTHLLVNKKYTSDYKTHQAPIISPFLNSIHYDVLKLSNKYIKNQQM